MERRKIERLFAGARQIKVLVIGDLMLDEYLWGKTDRISPEAPVQVVDVLREDVRLGGAGNVVSNLAALGAAVSVCSVIGDDDNGALLRSTFNDLNVGTDGLFADLNRRTGKKTRVMASHQQIVRIDRETKDALHPEFEIMLINWLQANICNYHVLVVSDYLKGVLTPAILETIITLGKSSSIPVVVDPKGSDYSKYCGATILTPNRKEAEQASAIAINDEASLNLAAAKLLESLKLSALLITRSEAGMSLFRPSADPLHIPTVAREVYDVTGAGDTVLALLSLGLASGLSLDDSSKLANTAAGIVVGKLGTSTLKPAEILDEIGRSLYGGDSKIKSLDALTEIIVAEKARGKRVVFTNGCFDLLHAGHVKYLQKARSLGDLLVLGLNSDASVRRLKGEKRPLISEDERAHILAALDCIDHVVIFDEDTPLTVIERLKPFILAKGGDYTLEGVVGREIVEAEGGRVELVQFVDGKSTTNIIEKILESYGE
ncbi:MAG: bifunctional D-glycero-beta-D-manno-heptose-7-phosphate kinase/D-glycero-beta-D-manno-heptose 1-phosphate adenylyltransferase HldE [Geobacteraceae bacterium]|nr:bifunctional D-glycero-beta-D-manno-heptose-7-phosphate kinase/D-glycero-beta-D-manno-heptose 1-phosphate adenylyltransferase HldE [Geobacteraceae bacterium]